MKLLLISILLFGVGLAATTALSKTSGDIIASHGYSWDNHTVQTSDGYLLTLFRMQRSNLPNNQMESNKPAVLLMHGIECSSDVWLWNGPNDGLAYMLADAGYDVWLGNARGNSYSLKHASMRHCSPLYWNFSWHEIGVYDIPAMIDYIISTTAQMDIHYVGHSQGSTTFMALLSTLPSYNEKIKTSHLLSPIVFMKGVKFPFIDALASFNAVFNILSRMQIAPIGSFIRDITQKNSKPSKIKDLLSLLDGGVSIYRNQTILPYIYETQPSGASLREYIHYLQLVRSGKFRRYNHGPIINFFKYQKLEPPEYQLENINTRVPIDMYYGDNDVWVPVENINLLKSIMGDKISLHKITASGFTHSDFITAINVKDVVNDCIVARMNKYENKPFEDGNGCSN